MASKPIILTFKTLHINFHSEHEAYLSIGKMATRMTTLTDGILWQPIKLECYT